MNAKKKARLEAAGFRFGDAADFLGLSAEEEKVIELRLLVAELVRVHRLAVGLTQQQLAEKIGSSQPRIAKVESGAGGVSLDLRFRSLFAVGGSLSDLTATKRRRSPKKRSRSTPRPRPVAGR